MSLRNTFLFLLVITSGCGPTPSMPDKLNSPAQSREEGELTPLERQCRSELMKISSQETHPLSLLDPAKREQAFSIFCKDGADNACAVKKWNAIEVTRAPTLEDALEIQKECDRSNGVFVFVKPQFKTLVTEKDVSIKVDDAELRIKNLGIPENQFPYTKIMEQLLDGKGSTHLLAYYSSLYKNVVAASLHVQSGEVLNAANSTDMEIRSDLAGVGETSTVCGIIEKTVKIDELYYIMLRSTESHGRFAAFTARDKILAQYEFNPDLVLCVTGALTESYMALTSGATLQGPEGYSYFINLDDRLAHDGIFLLK